MKGLGGSGRLTEGMVEKLQLYYGIAIRKNKGKDVAEMKRAIWGGFFHIASSKEKHWHDHCEPGPDSRCKYQAAIANKTQTYKHGPGLPAEVLKHVKPLLIDLRGRHRNQNQNFSEILVFEK